MAGQNKNKNKDKNKGKQAKRAAARQKARALRQAYGDDVGYYGDGTGVAAGFGIPPSLLPRPVDSGILMRAEQGDPDAMHEAGLGFDLGLGVERDKAKAAAWYQKAVDAGSREACSQLAALYMRGEGVPRDPARADALFAQGAMRGDAEAQVDLARVFVRRLAESQNGKQASDRVFDLACQLYEQAHAGGHPTAAAELVQLYLEGSGSSRDPQAFARALALLEEAVQAGNPDAMACYAELLRTGQGVEADPERAAEILAELERHAGQDDEDGQGDQQG